MTYRKMPKGARYDKEKADTAVEFINSLCHVHGEWAGKPFNLMKWQEKISENIVHNAAGGRQAFKQDSRADGVLHFNRRVASAVYIRLQKGCKS